jgi:hypothetical protein
MAISFVFINSFSKNNFTEEADVKKLTMFSLAETIY